MRQGCLGFEYKQQTGRYSNRKESARDGAAGGSANGRSRISGMDHSAFLRNGPWPWHDRPCPTSWIRDRILPNGYNQTWNRGGGGGGVTRRTIAFWTRATIWVKMWSACRLTGKPANFVKCPLYVLGDENLVREFADIVRKNTWP